MTEEEKEQLINEIVERILLMIPEVVGNLITDHSYHLRINKKFYKDHPEFRDKKDIVASVVEMVEGKHTLADYETILKEAIPEIQERIRTVTKLSLDTPISAHRNLDSINFKDNGEL